MRFELPSEVLELLLIGLQGARSMKEEADLDGHMPKSIQVEGLIDLCESSHSDQL